MTRIQGKTQHQRIIDLCKDRGYVCQAEFWTISKSPHKRRSEIEEMGYKFHERKCEHGIVNSKDFALEKVPQYREVTRIEVRDGRAYQVKQMQLV